MGSVTQTGQEAGHRIPLPPGLFRSRVLVEHEISTLFARLVHIHSLHSHFAARLQVVPAHDPAQTAQHMMGLVGVEIDPPGDSANAGTPSRMVIANNNRRGGLESRCRHICGQPQRCWIYLVILGIYKVAGVAVGKVQERIGAKCTRVVRGKQMRVTSSKVVSGVQLIAKGVRRRRIVNPTGKFGTDSIVVIEAVVNLDVELVIVASVRTCAEPVVVNVVVGLTHFDIGQWERLHHFVCYRIDKVARFGSRLEVGPFEIWVSGTLIKIQPVKRDKAGTDVAAQI